MLRATLKSLLSRKARLLLSSIAVILGVTFVSASLVLNASLGASVQSMFTTVYDDIDIEISSAKTTKTYLGETPGTVPQDVIDDVSANSDVDRAQGTIRNDSGLVRVLDKNDKVLPQMAAPTIGQNWEEPQDPIELRDGTGPREDDEIVVSQSLLNATGYELGDTVPIITNTSEPEDYEIAGVVGYSGGRDSVSGEMLVMFTMDTARESLIDGEAGYTHITVDSNSGVDNSQLRDDLAAAIGDDYKVRTGKDLAEEQTESFQAVLDLFNYLLLGFGGVALLVSVFLIINTFSIIVAQRTRELALFRAVGASRSQIRGSVLLEATLIGVLSAVIGLAFGIGIGHLGNVIVTSTMDEAMTATLIVPISAVIAAVAIGVGVTVVAAALPALRASRIPPIAALRDSSNTIRPVRWFAIFGSLFLAAGGVLLWAGLSKKFGEGDPSLFGTVGAVGLLFVGALVIIPAIAKPLVAAIGSIMSWTLAGKLGRRNSSRNPRRTAITASALMIGVAIVTGVGVLASSTEASIQKFFDNSVSADIVVAAGQQGQVMPTFDPALLDDMEQMDDVHKVAGMYLTSADIDGEDAMVTATDNFAGMADLLGDNIVKGEETLKADEIAVYENQAEKANLELGDTISVALPKGEERTMTLKSILESESGSSGYILTADHADEFSESEPVQAFVQVNEGADKKDVMKDVDALLKDNPQIAAFDMSEQTEQIGQVFDIILLSVQILLGLAMLIAVIGVVNTLTLSVLERTRELGLIRAVGMTRWQVTSMVAVEAVVISVFGAILGIGIGAGLGIAVQQALKDDFIDVLAMPWSTMVTYLIAAVVIGLFSAIIPAYRANKLDVLEAVSAE